MKRFSLFFGMLVVCLFGRSTGASAADCTWTGLSTAMTSEGNEWTDPTNWTNCNNNAPQVGDNVIFPDGAARPVSSVLQAGSLVGFSIGSLTITGRGAGPTAWHITGAANGSRAENELSLTSLTVTAPPDGIGDGPSLPPFQLGNQTTVTVNLDPGGASTLMLGDINLNEHTLTFNLSAPATVQGSISNNCGGQPTGLIKDGPSILTLNANIYCGATVIKAGTVIAANSNALGAAIDDLVTAPAGLRRIAQGITATGGALTQVLAGATLQLGNNVGIGDSIELAGRITVPQLFTAAINGDVAYSSGASIVPAGVLTLNGHLTADTTPARLVVNGGSLTLNGPVAFQLNGSAPGTGYDQLQLTSAARLTLGAGAQLVLTRGFDVLPGQTLTLVDGQAGATVTGTFQNLPDGASLTVNGEQFTITYHGGNGNSVVLTPVVQTPPPPPQPTYFLSEGATGDFFDEDILIANPNGADAPVTLTFSKEDGSQVVATRTVPAQARLTVHVDQIAGLEKVSGVSAQIRSDNRLPLVVERSMFWDASYYAGSTGSSVETPAQDWFFAEGSQGFFFTFILVNNPNPTPTDVTFTFFLESGKTVTKTITVGATTRLTLYAGDVPDLVNQSFGTNVHATQPIMAERSMYFGTRPDGRVWSGGTESAGVTALSSNWFLAEGATGGFFTTYILLSNPNSTTAHVTLQYLLNTGETISVPKVVAPNTRLTTNIAAESDVRLKNAAVSTVVTSDQPIIAERSMYWPGAVVPFGEGHNSFGVVNAGLRWGLAEGRTGTPLNYHTYILLANPNATAANVTVSFLRETGAPVVKTFTVAPTSRFNIDSATITELHDEYFGAIVQVTNNVPIIVERSLYWDSNGFAFSGGTNATGIALPPAVGGGSDVQVTITGGLLFNPNPVTVATGQTITWKDTSGIGHHIVANDGSFDTGVISGGTTSAVVTFTGHGDVTYHCTIHPQMVGTISGPAATTARETSAVSAGELSTVACDGAACH